MSVIKEPYATPSRMLGVYRLILQVKGQRMKRQDMEDTLSPKTLIAANEQGVDESKQLSMVHAVVNEMIKMELLKEEGEDVMLSDSLPRVLLDRNKGDAALPRYITDLLFSTTNQENYDFARFLAWFLAQDPLHGLGEWTDLQNSLVKQVGSHSLEFNNKTKYDQFCYWSKYCGFGWSYHLDIDRFVPDPTAFLTMLLPELVTPQQTMELTVLMRKVAERCPVFEGGRIREALEKEYGYVLREPYELSASTSHSLLRLREEEKIELEMRSDGDALTLQIGDWRHRFTHITWLNRKERS